MGRGETREEVERYGGRGKGGEQRQKVQTGGEGGIDEREQEADPVFQVPHRV